MGKARNTTINPSQYSIFSCFFCLKINKTEIKRLIRLAIIKMEKSIISKAGIILTPP